jgi:hypothetical protein
MNVNNIVSSTVTDAPEYKCHRHTAGVYRSLALVLCVVLLYVVSVAPAARLAAMSGRVSVWLAFMKTYKPAMLLRGTPLRGLFDWWVGLWVDDLKPFSLSGGKLWRTNPAAPGTGAVALQCHTGRHPRVVPEQQCSPFPNLEFRT